MHSCFGLFLSMLLITAPAGATSDTGNQDFKVSYQSYPWSVTSRYNIERSDGTGWHASRNNLTSIWGFKYDLYDAEGQSTGTLSSRWEDPAALRASTANLEYRDGTGDRYGRLRGNFWNTQLLQMDIYNRYDIKVGVIRCSMVDWLTCEVKTDAGASQSVATMQHSAWNVWNVAVHRDGLIEQGLLELAPLYLHDYVRAVVYHRTVLQAAGLWYIP